MPLYAIAPTWFVFNGTIITIILGLIFSFIFGKNELLRITHWIFISDIDSTEDSKAVDRSLLVSLGELVPFCSSRKVSMTRFNLSIVFFIYRKQENERRCKKATESKWMIQWLSENQCLRIKPYFPHKK